MALHFKSQRRMRIPDLVIIPLRPRQASDCINLFGRRKQFVRYKYHAYQLGFSCTFHKVQGKTLARVILDLNKRPNGSPKVQVTSQGIYVGLTRVVSAKDIRIFPLTHLSANYLKQLRVNPNLPKWIRYLRRQPDGRGFKFQMP
jgi:hypothetical protein